MPSPDFNALEQKYNLPPGILAATQAVESGGNPGAVSPKGALGTFQFMPETAKALGIDPRDPMQAAEGAANHWRQNLDATKGDIDLAARYYQGGPNQKKWGAQNAAYPGQILAHLQAGSQPAPSGPSPDTGDIDQLFGKTPPAGSGQNSDIDALFNGGTTPPHASNPVGISSPAPVQPGNSGGANAVPSGVVPFRPMAQGQVAGPDGQGGQNGQGQDGLLTSLAKGGVDFASGIGEGFDKLQTSLTGLGLRETDAIGLTQGLHDGFNKFQADNAHARDGEYYNPDGYARPIGSFVGESAALAPVAELRGAQLAPEVGALARGLAKYGTLSGQGAVAGALSSGGDNIALNSAIGAGLAPVAGAALEKLVIPAVAGVGRLAGRGAGAVADGIAGVAGKFKSSAVDPRIAAEAPHVAGAIDAGNEAADILRQFPNANPDSVDAWVKYRAAGGKAPVSFAGQPPDLPTPLKPADVQQAMGSRGNNVGVEGSPDLPQDVHDHAAYLAGEGVPLDQALREARLTAIGAQPTDANVTRDPAALRAEVEGAKLDTVEGQALAAQRATNNGVVVNQMADTANGFSPTGKAPGSSEATQAAAETLAKASDAGRAKVTASYAAARAADPHALVEPTNIHAMLNSPEAMAVPASTPEGALLAQVRNTVEQGQLAHDSKILPTGIAPDAVNGITTMANRKFGADKAVNYWVNKITEAGDKDLGQIDGLGEAWKTARKSHADWASEFHDPIGVRTLIARDANGNFLNANAGAKNDALWTASNSTPAVQIIQALKNNGADDALGLIKSHVAQQAYEAATGRSGGNAVDQAGNSPVSGKAYHAFLNKVGDPKLGALFSPEELAQLTNLGHSANIINETPAGVNNASNTSSALTNAIARAERAAKPGKASGMAINGLPAIGALLGHLTGTGAEAGGIAGLITEPAAKAAAAALQRRSQNKAVKLLAEQLRIAGSPGAARTAANENAIAEQTAAQRKAAAESLARALAAPASTRKGQR